MSPITLGSYTLSRRLALVRVWRKAKAKHGIGRLRAGWIAVGAFVASRERRTVELRAGRAE